jgi:hypothetical protein
MGALISSKRNGMSHNNTTAHGSFKIEIHPLLVNK